MLRPIGTITDTARRVADRNLHERIALGGPRDEVRELADTFDEMLERLDHSFDGQRRFVANASHELKTPIAINRTMIEVALERPDAPDQLRALGREPVAVNARHERLIDGCSRSPARSRRSPPAPRCDLAAIATHVLDETDHGTLTVQRDLAPVPVMGDAVLLERLDAQPRVERSSLQHVPAAGARVRTEVRDGSAALTGRQLRAGDRALRGARALRAVPRLVSRVGSAKGTGLGCPSSAPWRTRHGGDVTAEAAPTGGLGGTRHAARREKLTTVVRVSVRLGGVTATMDASCAAMRSRGAILDAAVVLATEAGLDGLSLSQLAQRLGVSKSGLFAHWASKEELQLAVIEPREPAVDRPDRRARPSASRAACAGCWAAHEARIAFYAEGHCCRADASSPTRSSSSTPGPAPVRDRAGREVRRVDDAAASGCATEAVEVGETARRHRSAQLAFEVNAGRRRRRAALPLLDPADTYARARRRVLGTAARPDHRSDTAPEA
jgi:AcrR family transcriptional regulator